MEYMEARMQDQFDAHEANEDREAVGAAIYRALYEHKGGRWELVETKDVWFAAADRALAFDRRDLQQRLVDAIYGPGHVRSDTVEELTEALLALSVASPVHSGGEVVPLQWGRDYIRNEWHGNVVPGTGYNYLVKDDGRWCCEPARRWVLDQAGDVEAAKAAAQADYNARIRSALLPPLAGEQMVRQDALYREAKELERQGKAILEQATAKFKEAYEADSRASDIGFPDE